ncbi:MAG TPA: PD-(D/E)XK nuclease family transposase [Candidatus Cryptobacteroides pullicola]|nr:PD-(D/E)XK nuclease family transposase [Candidatus Cryptobacteroides pullicola]
MRCRVQGRVLNTVLPPDRKIEDLHYATTELPGITLYSKASRLDLRCRDTLGRNFIVEVQNYWQEYFFRRCAYYAARIYSYGVKKGDWQRYDVDPVFMIGLLNTDIGLGRDGAAWKDRLKMTQFLLLS